MSIKVLAVTNMYPYENNPYYGIFVKEQLELLGEFGVEIDLLFINGKKTKLNYFKGLFQILHKVRKKKYDLLHAHYVFCGLLARFQFRCPIVLTHHGIEVLRGYQSVLSRLISPLVEKVIVRSKEMRDKLGIDDASIIPAGIDLEMFKPMPKSLAREKLNLPLEKKLVLFAGDPRPEKRLDIIRKSVSLLKKKDDLIDLVIVSNQPHFMVPTYMNACDVLVLVSKAEGSPNVIKEAMACNLPIVSTDVGDVTEIIDSTEGCYICDGDPEGVAAQLMNALRLNKRTDGRKRILSLSMDSREIAKKIVRIYEDISGKSHTPKQ